MSSDDKLFEACGSGDEAGIAKALKAGANPNGRSSDHYGSAIQNVLSAQCPRGASLLVAAGANLTELDEYGYSPLHFAAYFGDAELITLMLDKGADPSAASKKAHPSYEYFKKGSTALDIAKRGDNDAITAALSRPAAKAAKTTKATNTAKAPTFQQKLDALRAFTAGGVDFEGSDGAVADVLAGKGRGKSLLAIGQTGSGSVFAFWRKSAKDALATAPVVYLDSEGEPRAVVARSLDELLTLLPYGTGFLYDVLQGARAAKAKDAAGKALAAVADEEQARDGKPILDWWKATFAVEPAKDPAAIVAAAQADRAELQAWLG